MGGTSSEKPENFHPQQGGWRFLHQRGNRIEIRNLYYLFSQRVRKYILKGFEFLFKEIYQKMTRGISPMTLDTNATARAIGYIDRDDTKGFLTSVVNFVY